MCFLCVILVFMAMVLGKLSSSNFAHIAFMGHNEMWCTLFTVFGYCQKPISWQAFTCI